MSKVDINPGGYTMRCSFQSVNLLDVDTVDASNGYYGANCAFNVSANCVVTIGNMKMKNSGYYYNSASDDITITTLDSTRPIHPSSPTTLPGRLMGVYWEPSVPDIHLSKSTAKLKVNGGILGGNIELTGGDILINNIQINDNYSGIIDQITGGTLQFRSFDQVSNDNRVYTTAHIFSPNTSVRRTASGYSIKAQVRDTTSTPTSLKIGSIIVNGGTAVTVSIYAYISGSSETVTLKIPGRSFMGLTSDQTASTSAINNWNAIIKTFTPTNSGELEVFVDFSNLNTSSVMYIDDFGVTQA